MKAATELGTFKERPVDSQLTPWFEHGVFECSGEVVAISVPIQEECAAAVETTDEISVYKGVGYATVDLSSVGSGKHLWLRNNGSTMISQLVDATAVIFITFGAVWWSGDKTLGALLVLVASNYLFKVAVAAVDTIPFYLGVGFLKRYLHIDPTLV